MKNSFSEIDWVHAVNVLKKNKGVGLIPTETVYGLVCRWQDQTAQNRISQMKNRDSNQKMQMLASDIDMIYQYDAILSSQAIRLLNQFAPGPIMLIVKTKQQSTLGFRISSHPIVTKLIHALNEPLAATSANRSGFPNATNCQMACQFLTEQPDFILDNGEIINPTASTIVDLTQNIPSVLREGQISSDQIIRVLQC